MLKKMRTFFFPFKKLRRNVKYLLFVAVLMTGVLAAYLEFVATTNTWNDNIQFSPWNEVNPYKHEGERESGRARGKGRPWESSFVPQPWRPEYKGQANMHIFEDWCGGSVAQLRKNLHYPLYPHSRTTVKKLAVTPRWTNYGLRIFGYLHPHTDGKYLFAVASDDNSEFWLSSDESPLNVRLLALVGKTGTEWTAPGEFGKYASQTSHPVELKSSERYYFEIIHKQNEQGTDHVEVAWQTYPDGLRFDLIGSQHISLYTNESGLLMTEVAHVPQSAASRARTAGEGAGESAGASGHGADMLREDRRDSLHQLPLIDEAYLDKLLPDCIYRPSYIIKGFPLLRYQGLQFVYMSYIYPNDYTRLTHMETENKCFYHSNPQYIKRNGFYRYMKLDVPEGFEDGRVPWDNRAFDELEDSIRYEDVPKEDSEGEGVEDGAEEKSNDLPDYGDDYDDYTFKRRRKLFSALPADGPELAKKRKRRDKASVQEEVPAQLPEADQREDPEVKVQRRKKSRRKSEIDPNEVPVPIPHGLLPVGNNASQLERARQGKSAVAVPARGMNAAQVEHHLVAGGPNDNIGQALEKPRSGKNRTLHRDPERRAPVPAARLPVPSQAPQVPPENHPRPRARAFGAVPQSEIRDGAVGRDRMPVGRWGEVRGKEAEQRAEPEQENAILHVLEPPLPKRARGDRREPGASDLREDAGGLWKLEEDAEEYDEDGRKYEATEPAVAFDPEVNWGQTFEVNPLDFHSLRSDWIDLSCNVSGNLLLKPEDALDLAQRFMSKLEQRHPGRFSLLQVVNVEKRVDPSYGGRYLLELELQEQGGGRVRLSRYVYLLQRRGRPRALGHGRAPPELVLCSPRGFTWNPSATVHFIVPVKNQARWVRQFILDMEQLYRDTGDGNFNIIITDYSSTDMDVEQELKSSSLPRYQYVKLSGNFERSAGLQAGIDLITDDHSIVFLCDLHIHFPQFIVDSIRKHCVEGRMAYAPIVLRLDCGATPLEPNGFWEVNGFGLLGIYKSDLDAAGGMNTKEFRDRWGGEDWELLDRILQAGLEVERIYLRNFMHHYHSKRGMWNRQPRKGA
ncbi:beta-1,4-N-acetylgalactosaminyltransferase 3-like [Anguilla anguilla]|uniref:beta-1,4-N-acetylgalactosaminyltransferase 3-like n=1 Tax=Anguilla anguilla TaxID=7936 RepID=UPI0015B19D54|nr:beta-1,4-N-acetylgalactosaminyltransferase 3-like [Anguilla anguilla]